MDITVTGRVLANPATVVLPLRESTIAFRLESSIDKRVYVVNTRGVLSGLGCNVKEGQILTVFGRIDDDKIYAEKIEFKGESMNESVKLPESISDLDPSRLYWWGNAEELHEGDEVLLFCYVAHPIEGSKKGTIHRVKGKNKEYRFLDEEGYVWPYAYLLSRKPTPKYRPWKTLPEEIKPGVVVLNKARPGLEALVLSVSRLNPNETALIGNVWFSLTGLFEKFTLFDGTPCGEEYYE